MDQNTIQSEIGGCPKSDHAKMHVFIGIYSVFKGSVDHGGGVSKYLYIHAGCPFLVIVQALTGQTHTPSATFSRCWNQTYLLLLQRRLEFWSASRKLLWLTQLIGSGTPNKRFPFPVKLKELRHTRPLHSPSMDCGVSSSKKDHQLFWGGATLSISTLQQQ